MISSFQGEYRWLSNFWPCLIKDKGGRDYPSVEHAYQAGKCANQSDMKLFQSGTASEARKIGRHITMRKDWNSIKVELMRRLLRKKFAEDSELAKKLISTGNELLVEGNYWNDKFWGQCPLGVGENWLGKLLMERRKELDDRTSDCG